MSKKVAPTRRHTKSLATPVVLPVVLPILAKVVRPVATRLTRMEALLIEMRYEQDVQLKRITALQVQIESVVASISRAKRR